MQKRRLGKSNLEISAMGLGCTKLHRLEENIGAVSVELTPDDLRDIEAAASKITVQGARYPEKLEQMTGR
jgi:aryl-alcohol dehydrogenase-like predicted oxidoreductase